MEKKNVVFVSGVRTPFVKSNGVFANIPPAQLGGVALRETLDRVRLSPKEIEEVCFGIVSPPAEGTNVAREALFDAGLDPHIPCTTINRYCASSLEAAATICAKIQAGHIEIGLAGGVESISSIQALFSLQSTRFFQGLIKQKTLGKKLRYLKKFKLKYLMPNPPGIKEPTTGLTMGQSGDLMTRVFKVGRKEQDEFALRSHQKAHQGWQSGFFQKHVVPVPTPEGKVIAQDNIVRADSSLEKLQKLRPVFYRDGTITAGNASPLTDGASAALLMSEEKAKALSLPRLCRIRAYATAGVNIQKEPLLIGPVYALPKVLKKAGIRWEDLDLVEIHEAFAGQVLATIRAIESDTFAKEKLGLSKAIGKVDFEKLNLYGGSVALGHPFGATGTRMIAQASQLLHEKKKNLALLSVCTAGGMGAVMIIEAIAS